MKIFSCTGALLAILSGACWAASTASPAAPEFPTAAPYWLKVYSTVPFRETWSENLAVGNLEKDLPRVLKALSAGGGLLDGKLKTFVSSRTARTQQLVLTVPRARAGALQARLRKLGTLSTPTTGVIGGPIPRAEVRAKIDALMKERVDHAAEFDKMPVARAVTEEVLESLLRAEAAAKSDSENVRVDLLVRQR